MSQKEVAERLNISASTLSVRIAKIKGGTLTQRVTSVEATQQEHTSIIAEYKERIDLLEKIFQNYTLTKIIRVDDL